MFNPNESLEHIRFETRMLRLKAALWIIIVLALVAIWAAPVMTLECRSFQDVTKALQNVLPAPASPPARR